MTLFDVLVLMGGSFYCGWRIARGRFLWWTRRERPAPPVHLPDVEIIGPTNADLRELDRRLTHHRSGRPRGYIREHGTTP